MTDPVSSTTATNQNVQSATNAAATSAITSDFETFLRMMTAQLENQDPLNPIESADFAVQLATFSGVEQQVKTNELLEDLGNQMELSSIAELAGFVGMEARASVPVRFEGAPVDLSVELANNADGGDLVVRDSFNREVQRLALSPGTTEARWVGLDENGTQLPWDTYSFEVESRLGDEVIETRGAEIYAPVIEARIVNGQAQMVLGGGFSVNSDEVTAIRQPQ